MGYFLHIPFPHYDVFRALPLPDGRRTSASEWEREAADRKRLITEYLWDPLSLHYPGGLRVDERVL